MLTRSDERESSWSKISRKTGRIELNINEKKQNKERKERRTSGANAAANCAMEKWKARMCTNGDYQIVHAHCHLQPKLTCMKRHRDVMREAVNNQTRQLLSTRGRMR
jgi:hypothetical protein